MKNNPFPIRWEKGALGSWRGMRGNVCVGNVGTYDPRCEPGPPCYYRMSEISVKFIAKGHGDVATISAGKRAVERAWHKWLIAAEFIA